MLRSLFALLFAVCGLAHAATPDVSTKRGHSLAIDTDGNVYAWGNDANGQLGSGRTLYLTTPTAVAGIPAMASVTAGLYHVLAVDNFGNVWSWGGNDGGQLGTRQQPLDSRPARVLGIAGVTQVAAGQQFSAALRSDGTVWVWGTVPGVYSGARPLRVPLLANVTRIAAGDGHLLALKSDGTVWALGANTYGQLGDGTQASRIAPQAVPGATGIIDIAAGYAQSLALKSDNTVLAWGANYLQTSVRLSPAPVAGLTNVVAIAAGQYSFAVTSTGTVMSWDNNYAPAAFPPSPAPSPYAGIKKLAIGAGATGYTTYALDASGALSTQGGNWVGQHGTGNITPTNAITPVAALTGLTHISAGFYFAVARRGSDGAIFVWGANQQGALADPAPLTRSHPVSVAGLPGDITAVKAGTDHSLALESTGDVWAWGDNDSNQLGFQYLTPSSVPTAIPGLSNVTAIAAGCTHSLFLKGDGTVWFTGFMSPQTSLTLTPTQVAGLSNIVAIASGCHSAFAIRNDGAFYAWGSNGNGQLGDGTTTGHASPVLVTSIPGGVASIDITDTHALALTSGGAVWAWGNNLNGQIGDGTLTQRNSPVQVPGISTATQIAAGSSFSVVLLADGSVRSWGINANGTLGDGTRSDRSAPVTVLTLNQITRIAAGVIALAERNGGSVWGWGRGLTGDGTLAIRTKPTIALREGAAGNLDGGGADKWFLDLDPAPDNLPAAAIVRMVPIAVVNGDGSNVSLTASINFRSADYGKNVGTYILGRVPPAFLAQANVQLAPSVTPALVEKLQKAGNTILVQLTPQGWMTVSGQLVAYSSGVINSNGGANNILNGVPVTSIPGAQFCIGYGDSAGSMLSSEALRSVLDLEGASSSASGLPCVLSGMYVSGPPTSIAGTPVTLNALVVGVSPTGSVQLRDDGAGFQGNLGGPLALTPQNEALATAAFVASGLAPGVHAIGGSYSGDGQNPSGTVANPLSHVVAPQQAGTIGSLGGPASSTLGQAVSFTDTVFGNAPTGTVQFKDGANNLGAPIALFGGAATLTIDTLTLGGHSITAIYSGDGGNAGSTSNPVAHTVYNAIVTQVSLDSSPNPATPGANVTLTATVTGNAPTGSVTFRAGAAPMATVALVNGSASFATTAFPPGVNPVSADYSGDGTNAVASSGTLFQEVDAPPPPAPTVTTLIASVNPSALAQVVTFTATISGTGGASGGTVQFRDGAIPITGCSAVAVTSATAACTTNALTAGTHAISAVFSGASSFEGSSSAPVTQTVNATAPLLTANPTSIDFGGMSMNTTSPPSTVTLTNNSAGSVTVSSLSLPPGFAVASNGCTAAIAHSASCQVSIVFVPGVQGAVTGLFGVNYAGGGPTAVAITGTGEKSLTTHYYWSVLRRAPDAPGKAFWESEAARMTGLGANINETWFAMSAFFFFSAEYLAFNRDDNGFVTDLYVTFFNRAPDAPGLVFWTGQLASGMPREVVLAAFMFSTEFVTFTQAIFGNTAARAEVDVVMDFYRGLLARLPDNQGFGDWRGSFRNAQCAGYPPGAVYTAVANISTGFIASAEYVARNRTNSQYVGDLYNAMLRRGGDLGGVQFWINQLNTSAMTRETVRQNFVASTEFTARVTNVVNQGCLPP